MLMWCCRPSGFDVDFRSPYWLGIFLYQSMVELSSFVPGPGQQVWVSIMTFSIANELSLIFTWTRDHASMASCHHVTSNWLNLKRKGNHLFILYWAFRLTSFPQQRSRSNLSTHCYLMSKSIMSNIVIGQFQNYKYRMWLQNLEVVW